MPADAPPSANAAVDYLNALYRSDDRLAIVVVGRHGPDPDVEQRVVTARAASGSRPFRGIELGTPNGPTNSVGIPRFDRNAEAATRAST